MICTYYYKPKTKYPARIYLIMNAEQWASRNFKPMGIMNRPRILTRPMTKIEEEEKSEYRLQYFQYETVGAVIVNDFKCEVDIKYIQLIYNELSQKTMYHLKDQKNILPLSDYLEMAEKELGFKLPYDLGTPEPAPLKLKKKKRVSNVPSLF